MTILITNPQTSQTLALPQDLYWADELTWSAVVQATERSIDGALIADAAARSGGRPITLQGEGDSAWIDRATLRQLKSWADVPGLRLLLDIRGEAFTVVFDHGADETSNAFAFTAVVTFADMQDGDYYCALTLRFLEASEIL